MPKGIFIGLGGAGMKTVAKLKALLFQRAYNSSKAAMDNDCSFIFYDTDTQTERSINNDYELQRMMNGLPVIDYNEFIDAGATAPYILYKYAKNAPTTDTVSQRMLEWAIDPDVPGNFKLPQKHLCEGSGIQRMAGRCGFVYKRKGFEEKIRGAMHKLEDLRFLGLLREDHPSIWVFSSSNGGTSSSALLDVLYLVDRLYKRHVADVNPYVRLVLYMPKAFIDRNKMIAHYYSRNAFATLWELNEFRNDLVLNNDGKKFGAFAAQPDRQEWATITTPWQVCSYVMAVDVESQKGRVSLDQMYANTAELCYYMHTGAAGGEMVEYLDYDLAPGGPFYGQYTTSETDQFKWSKFLVGSGFKAIVKSDDFLKDYVRKRFRYDMFGYGLMGQRFEKILPTPEQRKEAAKAFADKYILNYLINLSVFEQSPRDSLYGIYQRAFETVMIPSDAEIPSRDDWNNLGAQFTTECKVKIKSISSEFDSPTYSSASKWEWIKKIEQSVKQGVDECIVDFGLEYTYSLLAWVDDEYCEKEVMKRLNLRNNLYSLETDIENIISANRPRRGIGVLVEKMKKYKQACIYELAVQHIRTIIQEITQERVGFLEYLRKGDQNHKGILGLIQTFKGSFTNSKEDLMNLASTFKKTANDVCSDYFPPVSEFVKEGDAWAKHHLFENLYSTIVPLDTREDAVAYEEGSNFGCPPQRNLGDKGLSAIIGLIKNRVPNHDFLFADLALSNPMTEFGGMSKSLLKEIDSFIENAMENSSYGVKTWLDMPLQTIFDEYFSKDGAVDMCARTSYVNKFIHSVPVFYPIALGAMPQTADRWLYVGATPEFAAIMGFQQGAEKQYIADPYLGHRFLLCRLEVGHSFMDYKYFDMLRAMYEAGRPVIENEGGSCHIHQDFVKLDLGFAYSKHKAKRFDEFIALCWCDCFFEYLDSLQNKDYVEAFFGNQSKYEPIVAVAVGDELEVSFKAMGLCGDCLILSEFNKMVLRFQPHSLVEWQKAVIGCDLDYNEYFDRIAEVSARQSNDLKEEIRRIYRQASPRDEAPFDGEIMRIFKKKLTPLFSCYAKTKNDEKTRFIISYIIKYISAKDIFY